MKYFRICTTICILLLAGIGCNSRAYKSVKMEWPSFCPPCDSTVVTKSADSLSIDSYRNGKLLGCFIRQIGVKTLSGLKESFGEETKVSLSRGEDQLASILKVNDLEMYSTDMDAIWIGNGDTNGMYIDIREYGGQIKVSVIFYDQKPTRVELHYQDSIIAECNSENNLAECNELFVSKEVVDTLNIEFLKLVSLKFINEDSTGKYYSTSIRKLYLNRLKNSYEYNPFPNEQVVDLQAFALRYFEREEKGRKSFP